MIFPRSDKFDTDGKIEYVGQPSRKKSLMQWIIGVMKTMTEWNLEHSTFQ